MGERIPVHVVTGTDGAGEMIARLCAAKTGWVGLVSTPPSSPIPNVRAIAAGCPCCTGRVVLQISLVRALREMRAERAFVEVSEGHAASLERVLAEPPLGLSVIAARRIRLPRDAALSSSDLEDPGRPA